MAISRSVVGCVLAVCLAGCGADRPTGAAAPEASPASKAPATDSPTVKQVASGDLPPLGDYLPPLDGGRIEIAPPEGWRVGGRRSGYLVRFFTSGDNDLPRILVTVDEWPSDQMSSVDSDNASEFAAFVQGELEQQETTLLEPALALIFGDWPWTRYVAQGSRSGVVVERQVLTTLANGRRYTIELQVFSGTILQHRDLAYAVAAGMKFLGDPAESNDDAPEKEKVPDTADPTSDANGGSDSA